MLCRQVKCVIDKISEHPREPHGWLTDRSGVASIASSDLSRLSERRSSIAEISHIYALWSSQPVACSFSSDECIVTVLLEWYELLAVEFFRVGLEIGMNISAEEILSWQGTSTTLGCVGRNRDKKWLRRVLLCNSDDRGLGRCCADK